MKASSDPISLANFLRELGYGATYSPNIILAVLEQLGIFPANLPSKLTDADFGQVLRMMALTHSTLGENPTLRTLTTGLIKDEEIPKLRGMRTWNVELFFTLMAKMCPSLTAERLLRRLDDPSLADLDQNGFVIIWKAAISLAHEIQGFPTQVLLERWNNPQSQLKMLSFCIQLTPDVFTVSQFNGRRVIPLDIPAANNVARSVLTTAASSPWNSLDLVHALIELSEGPLIGEVKGLFELGIQQAPDLLLLAFAQLQLSAPWSTIIKEASPSLVVLLLSGHPHLPFILPRAWQLAPSLVISGLVFIYSKDPTSLSRILDIAQEMKALSQILETKPFSFSIDLAALASRREYLNLEKWLQDHIREEGDNFIRACLELLNIKALAQLGRYDAGPSVPLSADVVATFLKILQANAPNMSRENVDSFKEVFAVCGQAYPRLSTAFDKEMTGIPGAQAAGGTPTQQEQSTFAPDVEEEANSYFERIYKGEFNVSQVIEFLQRFKSSEDPREQEVYKCMIHNLFDEYKFFERYPDKELAITSVLFGALIQHQVVMGMALGIALRYVLDALRQPLASRLFRFGVQALGQFIGRLPEWPQYCQLLLQIEQLHHAHPEVIQAIRNAQKRMGAVAGPQSNISSSQAPLPGQLAPGVPDITPVGSAPASSASAAASAPARVADGADALVFSSVYTENIIGSEANDAIVPPPENVQDKILFILNNVSENNLDSKVSEMDEIIIPDHFRWFSNYLVVKRVSIEPNFHALYISFMDGLKRPGLASYILYETLCNVRSLLNSEKTVTSSQERSLLKNLGTWLGAITLAKNIPIKHKNLAFKELLLEGYFGNRLIVVIPFVCKVLEQASQSEVFRPPNPWTMAIMRLLAELYHYAELKLNLKFEIEVLCKNIKLDIKDITPADLLRQRIEKASLEHMESSHVKQYVGPSSSSTAAAASSAASGAEDALSAIGYPSLASFVTFNPNITLFNTQPSLKRIVYLALDRSVREVMMSPVVERSVTIAVIATREIILKDFALEPNEERMRKAAHLMAQNLAGSLASVSSREPLRVSMISNFRNLLIQNGFTEQTVPEQVVYVIVSDNLDLACSVMEKTASEKAVPEIDESLAPAFVARRKHRERTGQPFYDMAVYASSRYPSSLPEPLRLRPGGLTSAQLRVYDDFVRLHQNLEDRQSKAAQPVDDGRSSEPPYGRASNYGALNPQQVPQAQSGPEQLAAIAQQALEKLNETLTELDTILSENPSAATLADIPAQKEVRTLVGQVPVLVSQTPSLVEDIGMLAAQQLAKLLFAKEGILAIEVYTVLLKKLADMSKKVGRELKEWLLLNDDERKYNVAAFISFLKSGVLSVYEVDTQLARQLENPTPKVLEFTTQFLKTSLCEADPLALPSDFFQTLDAYGQLVEAGKVSDELLEQLKKVMTVYVIKEMATAEPSQEALREHLGMLFREWVQVYSHPFSTEKFQFTFISQVRESGILKNDSISPLFFRTSIELAVESCRVRLSQGTVPANGSPFLAVDALARLIVLLVRYHAEPSGDSSVAKLNLTAKILSIVVLVLVHAHEQGQGLFNQRPFFRLFSSLLNELATFEEHLKPIYVQIMSAFSNTFHTLQPSFLPSFTFSWLQLISHRNFMPKLLMADSQLYWPFFQKLLVDLFQFLAVPLVKYPLTNTIRMLYKGALRILLVLLHDFPEFLCEYHFSLVDLIPHKCIQLRNLILSAFPRNMRLPDPFTPNLKVDLLPEINQSPRILSDFTSQLVESGLKQQLDQFLSTGAPVQFPSQLLSSLLLPEDAAQDAISKYNTSLIDSIVLYIGVQALAQVEQQTPQISTIAIANTPAVDIYQNLVNELDEEGRYLVLSSIANHLRYPNSHTHYFSCVLLYLFSEAKKEIVQEQLTRVLIERLIVNRPHPYGLLITFIELIRNPRYNFWEHTSFITGAPEIERLFQNVAKSINNSMSRLSQ